MLLPSTISRPATARTQHFLDSVYYLDDWLTGCRWSSVSTHGDVGNAISSPALGSGQTIAERDFYTSWGGTNYVSFRLSTRPTPSGTPSWGDYVSDTTATVTVGGGRTQVDLGFARESVETALLAEYRPADPLPAGSGSSGSFPVAPLAAALVAAAAALAIIAARRRVI